MASNSYVLGHTVVEIERLISQADFYRDQSQHLLHLAGLREGMRVLDIGCGPGDVSLLAARIVGPSGHVVGVDRSQDAITLANARAAREGVTNVRFEVCDVQDLTADRVTNGTTEAFHALIGRFVLMYFSDAALVLRQLMRMLQPNAIVTFQEMDIQIADSSPRGELFASSIQRIWEAFRFAGVDLRTGLRQARIFRDAGLPVPSMHMEVRADTGPDAFIYQHITETTRTLLETIQRADISTSEAVGIDTLKARLREEALRNDATMLSPGIVGAWTRVAVG